MQWMSRQDMACIQMSLTRTKSCLAGTIGTRLNWLRQQLR
jgi:hypothetical protein